MRWSTIGLIIFSQLAIAAPSLEFTEGDIRIGADLASHASICGLYLGRPANVKQAAVQLVAARTMGRDRLGLQPLEWFTTDEAIDLFHFAIVEPPYRPEEALGFIVLIQERGLLVPKEVMAEFLTAVRDRTLMESLESRIGTELRRRRAIEYVSTNPRDLPAGAYGGLMSPRQSLRR